MPGATTTANAHPAAPSVGSCRWPSRWPAYRSRIEGGAASRWSSAVASRSTRASSVGAAARSLPSRTASRRPSTGVVRTSAKPGPLRPDGTCRTHDHPAGRLGRGSKRRRGHVPSATDELMFSLHAIDVSDEGRPRAIEAISFSPIAGVGDGRLVVVGALTAFSGTATPLRWRPRRSLRLTGAQGLPVEVDLGVLARRRPIPAPWQEHAVTGWGVEAASSSEAEELEFSAADDAEILVAGQPSSVRDLLESAGVGVSVAGAHITVLEALDRRVRLEVVDADGHATAARIPLPARDGRYLPRSGMATTSMRASSRIWARTSFSVGRPMPTWTAHARSTCPPRAPRCSGCKGQGSRRCVSRSDRETGRPGRCG